VVVNFYIVYEEHFGVKVGFGSNLCHPTVPKDLIAKFLEANAYISESSCLSFKSIIARI
jgi:hypothetical protein